MHRVYLGGLWEGVVVVGGEKNLPPPAPHVTGTFETKTAGKRSISTILRKNNLHPIQH